MSKYIGQPIQRKEDPRFLSGKGLFIDDVELPRMGHVAFYRSDYAHARIKSIDVSAARQRPGVIAVYTADDFGDYWHAGPLQVPPPSAIEGSTFQAFPMIPIAKDKVRYSGEPLAIIVAESRYIAEDAFDDIVADLEPLDAVVDMEEALKESAPLVHEEGDSNLAALVKQENGSFAKAKEEADFVISQRFYIDRGAGGAMENRGLVVDWDDRTQKMTVWATVQAPIVLRNAIAGNLGLSDSQIQVMTPDIGGGFGPKIMTSMPDDVLIPWLARELNRPLKWVEDRRENFLATTSERNQIHDCEIAFNKDGKVLGVSDIFYHNTGAYDPYGMTVPLNTQTHTIGSYDIPNFYTEIRMVFTNTMVVTPVRAAGRSYGVFVMERLMDLAAKKLGIGVDEIRRRNLVQPDQFPYKTGIIGQDFVENILDSGNYPETLRKAIEVSNYERFIKEDQPKMRAEGRYVGIGLVTFVEGTAVGPYEGTKVTVEGSGKVNLATGISTQGQGHQTSYSQIVAEQLGIDINDVRVITGDTGHFDWGAGTFASRGMTLVGTATYNSSVAVREKALNLASKVLETPKEELELVDGEIRVADIPQKSVKLGELALMANPMRGTVEPGVEPGLEATSYFAPPHGATGQGAVVMVVEVDPETFQVEILDLTVIHDCGKVINPLLLDGQVMGALSMGIGNSFFEHIIYDKNGQVLNASFMDYLLPTAHDMPKVTRLGHVESLSPLNPLGIKGVGEAGAIPTPACFMQALENALAPMVDLTIAEAPLTPSKLFELVQSSK